MRGVFGQVNYPFVGAVHACIPVVGGWEPGCWVGTAVLVEGVGPWVWQETVVWLEAEVEVLENWMAHFGVCLRCFSGGCCRDLLHACLDYEGIHDI